MTKQETKNILKTFESRQRQTILNMMRAYKFRPLADYSVEHLKEGYIFPQLDRKQPTPEKAVSIPFALSTYIEDIKERVAKRNGERLILGKVHDYSFMRS